MIICWDKLEPLRYSFNTERWYRGRTIYEYKDDCKSCKNPFLYEAHSKGEFCSLKCAKSGKHAPMFGKKLSIEARQKIREKAVGRVISEETRQKMRGRHVSKATRKKLSKRLLGKNLGKRRSKETCERMSRNHADVNGMNNPFFGKKHTKETRAKISKSHADVSGMNNPRFDKGDTICGDKNPNWRGGISGESYCAIWNDEEFKEYIIERDKEKFCWNPGCLGKGNKRVKHHIDYNKKNCTPENVITICNSCNSIANFNRDHWQAFYTELMVSRKLKETVI